MFYQLDECNSNNYKKKERYGNIFSKSEKKMKIITTLGKIKA